jgi:hypothetical protein
MSEKATESGNAEKIRNITTATTGELFEFGQATVEAIEMPPSSPAPTGRRLTGAVGASAGGRRWYAQIEAGRRSANSNVIDALEKAAAEAVVIMVEWCDATSCHGVDRRQRARRITSRMDCSGSGGRRARAAAIGASPRARQYWSRHSEASSSCPPGRRNR